MQLNWILMKTQRKIMNKKSRLRVIEITVRIDKA